MFEISDSFLKLKDQIKNVRKLTGDKIKYTEVITLSLPLYRNELEEFNEIHKQTLTSWISHNACKNLREIGIYQIMTNIVLNQKTILLGFEYFFGFKFEEGDYFLIFASKVGILAVIGVDNDDDLINEWRLRVSFKVILNATLV